MVFNALYEIALADIRRQFREHDIAVKLRHDDMMPPWSTSDEGCEAAGDRGEHGLVEGIDIAFVDDVMFMLADETAEGLHAKLRKAIDIVADTFASYGLSVNMNPGKTEIVWHLVGVRSRVIKRSCIFDGKSMVSSLKGRKVGIVGQYQHLGTIQHAGGSTLPDAKAKAKKCDAHTPLSP